MVDNFEFVTCMRSFKIQRIMSSTIVAEHNLTLQCHPWDCIRFRQRIRLFGVSKSTTIFPQNKTFININVCFFTLCKTTVSQGYSVSQSQLVIRISVLNIDINIPPYAYKIFGVIRQEILIKVKISFHF